MTRCPRCHAPLQKSQRLVRCPSCAAALGAAADITEPGLMVDATSELPTSELPTAKLLHRGVGGNTVEFKLAKSNILGRSTGATIQLADREVSRRHTSIDIEHGDFVLRDLGSSNGTFLNGRRVAAPMPLQDSDELLIGTTRLVFRRGSANDASIFRPKQGSSAVVAAYEAAALFPPADEIQDAHQLRRDYERLRVSFEFQRFVRVERDLHALLAKILDVAFNLIPAECGAVLLKDEPSGDLVVQAVRHRKPNGGRILISETLLQHVATRREGIITSDASEDVRFHESRSIIGLGVRSCMAVPLLSGRDVRGVMFLDSRERIDAFSRKDLELLTAVAGQATVAIENTDLIRKMEHSAAQRSFFERFLSPQLARQAEAGRIELAKGGQLQEVTVLFSDIRGFTRMCEHQPPQETVAMLNDYFELMADCVFAYDGIVDKFIGDAVMALFGAPVRADDDAERALRCAMLMQQKTREFNELRRAAGKPLIDVGIGLHTGEAVVGIIGSTKRLEYTAVGDTVNVASGFCSAASAGAVVVSDECARRAGNAHGFLLEPRAPMLLKGRKAPLTSFNVRARG